MKGKAMTHATTSRPTFRAVGEVRGYGPIRTTPWAALRDASRDCRDCRSLGGGAYSDREPIAIVAGVSYPVGTCGGTLSAECSATQAELLAVVGEEIAAGRGTRRPRLRRDDWRGWVVCGGALYRCAVKWPDGAEAHEVRIESAHLCDLQRP